MSKKKLGRVTITINGQQQTSQPGAGLKLGGIKRNEQNNDFETFFTEEIVNAEVTFQMPLGPGISLDAYRQMDDVTLTFTCDTGQRFILTQAWCADVLEVKGGSPGLVDLRFASPPAKELL